MAEIVPRRERRRDKRQGRGPAPRSRAHTRRRGSGLWIGVGVLGLLVLAILGLRAAGVFDPPAVAFNPRESRFDPAGGQIGTKLPDESNTHVPQGTRVSYGTTPPASGSHWGSPAGPAPWGIKDVKLADEVTVHNLEHGGIVIAYDRLTPTETDELKGIVRQLLNTGFPKIVLEPYGGLPSDAKVVVSAWTWQLRLQSVDVVPIVKFFRAHYDPVEAPERGLR